jgi:hypothetical protein
MQQAQRVDPRYRIVTQPVVAAHDAQLKASGKLRSLVAVLALGTVMLFVAVSIADAVTTLRADRGKRPGEGEPPEPLPLDLAATSGPRRGVRSRSVAGR